MKTTLSDIYQQILLNEAEKNNLQNPSQDEVGNLKTKQELFGSKPKAVEGPEKAKLQKGPSYHETTGSASKPSNTNTNMQNSKPASDPKTEKGEEMKSTQVDPTNKEEEEEEHEKKKTVKEEAVTLGAFETLFKKTLHEELEEDVENEDEDEELTLEQDDDGLDLGDDTEEDLEEEENDLIADLRDLQDRLSSILSKLEDIQDEEMEDEGEAYTDEDFDMEFNDEEPVKESMEKPKSLNHSKGKTLMNKKNKVGKLHPKGGKASGGKIKSEPTPKSLGDKKNKLQKGRPEVKSSVKKGEFIK